MEARVVYRTDRPVSRADLSNAALQMRADFGDKQVCERTDEISIVATDADGGFIGHASAEVSVRVHEGTAVETTADAYLSSLFVVAPQRSMGVGRELMHRIEGRLRERQCTHLWTQTAGYDGHGFYRKLGYEQLFDLPGFFQSGHSHIGFQLDLGRGTQLSMESAVSGTASAEYRYVERPATDAEQAVIDAGFVEQAQGHGCPLLEEAERVEVVVEPGARTDSDLVAGFASGLAYCLVDSSMNGTTTDTGKSQKTYRKDYVLTDLFVDLPFRQRGVGRQLLRRLEARVFGLCGIARIHAWVPATAAAALALLLSEGYTTVGERQPSRSMLVQKMRPLT